MVRPAQSEEEALRLLSTLLIAKELFTSPWYASSADALFESENREVLGRIERETADEIRRVRDVVQGWAKSSLEDQDAQKPARTIARVARVDFLREIISAKDAAGEGLEKAALVAPPHIRDDLLNLAAVDFRHANHLRDMLSAELERVNRETKKQTHDPPR